MNSRKADCNLGCSGTLTPDSPLAQGGYGGHHCPWAWAPCSITSAETLLDIGVEAQNKGAVFGRVTWTCYKTNEPINCIFTVTTGNKKMSNIHTSMSSLNYEDGTVCVNGMKSDINLTVDKDVDTIIIVEKWGNLGRMIESGHERMSTSIIVVTQGCINTGCVNLVKAINKQIMANGHNNPVFCAMDVNGNGLSTAQALAREDGIEVVLVTGDKECLERYNVTERSTMKAPQINQLKKLVLEGGLITSEMFEDGKSTNIEQHLSEAHPCLAGIIFEEIDSIQMEEEEEED